MADPDPLEAYNAALARIAALRDECVTRTDGCNAFRTGVVESTANLARVVTRLARARAMIQENVDALRLRLETALAAAGDGLLEPDAAAANILEQLGGPDGALPALDALGRAALDLAEQVGLADEEVTALEAFNRADAARDGGDGGGGGGLPPPPAMGGGGRRTRRRRRRRGGWTPQPCPTRCCSTGTKLHKRSRKCVARRRRSKRSRRRRRRRRRR